MWVVRRSRSTPPTSVDSVDQSRTVRPIGYPWCQHGTENLTYVRFECIVRSVDNHAALAEDDLPRIDDEDATALGMHVEYIPEGA